MKHVKCVENQEFKHIVKIHDCRVTTKKGRAMLKEYVRDVTLGTWRIYFKDNGDVCAEKDGSKSNLDQFVVTCDNDHDTILISEVLEPETRIEPTINLDKHNEIKDYLLWTEELRIL